MIKNGNAQRGRQDFLAKQFQHISRTAEKFPAEITQALNYIGVSIFSKIIYEREDGKIGFKLPFSKPPKKGNDLSIKCSNILERIVDTLKSSAQKVNDYMNDFSGGVDYLGKTSYPDVVTAALGYDNMNITMDMNTEARLYMDYSDKEIGE